MNCNSSDDHVNADREKWGLAYAMSYSREAEFDQAPFR